MRFVPATRASQSAASSRKSALLLGSAVVAACAPSAILATHSEPQPASSTPSAPPQKYPPPIATPRNVACTLTTDKWPHEHPEDGGGYHYLRFAPGGAPFARIFAGRDVELVVPAALSSAGAHLRIDTAGVVVEGHLEAAEMPLYAASPVVLSGVFIPDNVLRLVWRSAKPGKITVTADAGPRVRPRGKALSAELDCGQISIGRTPIEQPAIDALMKAPPGSDKPIKPWLMLRPGLVGLSTVTDGDRVVEIDVVEPPDDTVLLHPVRLLGKEQAWSRIALYSHGGALFGWVRNDALQRSTKEYLDLSHDSASIMLKGRRDVGSFFACKTDLPLFAEAGGEQRLVGRVRALTAFERVGVKGMWTIVDFPRSELAPAEDALLLLETSRQENCGPALAKTQ